MLPDTLEVITLFVDDIDEARTFYRKVFSPRIVYEDAVSSVLEFSNLMINLLQVTQAPELVEPMPVASLRTGASFLLTIRVDDADEVCARLGDLSVSLLNGPIDRPWGRRTAAFADPSGHVWEVAQVLKPAD